MTTLSDTMQGYTTPPKYPTACEIESYRSTANRVGRAETIALLRAGRPAAAYHRIAQTTTDELTIVGYGGVVIPAHEGMRRLAGAKRAGVA